LSRPLLRIATRGSPLARFQADLVGSALVGGGAIDDVELIVVATTGDTISDVPISTIAGRGVFTSDVERAVLEGRADVAVHSAKDLPSSDLPPGLVLAAVPARGDVRDCLVGRSLDGLDAGAVVATGSRRRRIQLAHRRPDLTFIDVRGNIATRLEKVPDGGAVVIAVAALERLGLLGVATEILDTGVMLPQVGQGALALRCRADDAETIAALATIDDVEVHRAVDAERAYLARLGGGCEAPVGALARAAGSHGMIELEALLASDDAAVVLRRRVTGTDPLAIGTRLADELAAAVRSGGGR
jgi:hydroxymethylbilane synthase